MGSPNCSEGGWRKRERKTERERERERERKKESERERWSECGVGSLNFEYEEWRVIKKKGRNGGRK